MSRRILCAMREFTTSRMSSEHVDYPIRFFQHTIRQGFHEVSSENSGFKLDCLTKLSGYGASAVASRRTAAAHGATKQKETAHGVRQRGFVIWCPGLKIPQAAYGFVSCGRAGSNAQEPSALMQGFLQWGLKLRVL